MKPYPHPPPSSARPPRHFGFDYRIRHVRGGRCLHVQRVPNLMPTQGINHMFDVEFHAATQVTTWYVGIYEGDFTPVAGTTMATIVAAATECTAYAETTRVAWVEAAAAAAAITNAAAEALFTINATKTIYGAFLSSISTKSNTSGFLASVTRFATPRPCISGDQLYVEIPFSLISTE